MSGIVAAPLIVGVVIVGEVPNTSKSVPVSSEMFAAIPAESVRLVTTPVVVATRMIPLERAPKACSADSPASATCVMKVASAGAPLPPPSVSQENVLVAWS
jgi:hypothetical protein